MFYEISVDLKYEYDFLNKYFSNGKNYKLSLFLFNDQNIIVLLLYFIYNIMYFNYYQFFIFAQKYI